MNATAEAIELENAPSIGKEEEAHAVIRKNMYWSMGLSIVPVPIFDAIAVAGLQARALNELSNLYDIPYSKHLVKNILASLVTGLGAVYLGSMLMHSALKFVPVVGQIASIAATPAMAGALTYAIGVVFVQHFESGGTFLDFDPKAVRSFFREKYEEGLKIVGDKIVGNSGKSVDSAKKTSK